MRPLFAGIVNIPGENPFAVDIDAGSFDTAGRAQTGRRQPAAREYSHLIGPKSRALCTFFQPGFSGAQAIHERRLP
jgi:hypothetical protein